jgi:predicted dehydrogenase
VDTRSTSRRDFLVGGGGLAAGAFVSGAIAGAAYAGEDNTIRLALIGCGGRGSGAVRNALEVKSGPVKLHAMADVYESKQKLSYSALSRRYPDQVDVPEDRKFLGFDAYKKAIDTLKPGDVALCTTHAYCRPLHVRYAIEKGMNVFMEKSFAPDPGGLHRMLENHDLAEKKGVRVGAGLMCRHSRNRQMLIEKIRAGDIGDVQLMRAYRFANAIHLKQRQEGTSLMEHQVRNAPHILWASSGRFIEWMIHQIDECCWVADGLPVKASGFGGRVPDSRDCGQNYDSFHVEYTFANGAKAQVDNRYISGSDSRFVTFLHGTKKAAQFSGHVHKGDVHTYKDWRVDKDNIDWRAPDEPFTAHQAEWNVLLDNIRNNNPQNETKRAVLSNFAALMGRAAVHTGREVTWDKIFASRFELAPGADRLDYDGPAPLTDDENGRYPVPAPGAWKEI